MELIFFFVSIVTTRQVCNNRSIIILLKLCKKRDTQILEWRAALERKT